MGAGTREGLEAFFRFLLQDADTGAPLGTDNVRLSLPLVRNTGKLDGTFEAQIKDNAGTVLVTVTGTFSATPITV